MDLPEQDVILVDNENDDQYSWAVLDCNWCERIHTHGAGDGTVNEDEQITKSSHCRNFTGTYELNPLDTKVNFIDIAYQAGRLNGLGFSWDNASMVTMIQLADYFSNNSPFEQIHCFAPEIDLHFGTSWPIQVRSVDSSVDTDMLEDQLEDILNGLCNEFEAVDSWGWQMTDHAFDEGSDYQQRLNITLCLDHGHNVSERMEKTNYEQIGGV